MRNLKRVLSLSLASIMLLGMMVIGSSAAQDYTDVDYDNDNVEAIEVLDAINVMRGDLDANGELAGTFRPGSDVKRSEMARIMAFLMDLDYDYYIGANPFNDMVGHWAEGYAATCAANGIIYGRGNGIYDPDATVTAVEAASMLMRALGYFQNPAVEQPDGFVISTIRQAGKINLFNRVDVKTDEPMTRNDVAQLVLNALQSGMVEPSTSLSVTTPDGFTVSTGANNYVYRVARNDDIGKAINETKAFSGNATDGLEGYVLDLGEQLYQGKLKLNDDIDVFGRPARRWEFDGAKVGTYVKDEQLREVYTGKVTGKDLVDLLTASTIEKYYPVITIDGIQAISANQTILQSGSGTPYFTKGNLIRSNTEAVGATNKGVRTEVYVDSLNEIYYIAIINTYLARATEDYNTNDKNVDMEVYGLLSVANDTALVKSTGRGTGYDSEILSPEGEDFPILTEAVEDGIYLVHVAENEIKEVIVPEILEEMTVSTFKRNSYLIADGETYNHAHTAVYDPEILFQYTGSENGTVINLKDRRYNVILDEYQNLIGLELVEDPKQFVFITGIDRGASNLSNLEANMNAIFTDGTMKTIKVNMTDSRDIGNFRSMGAIVNAWCSYTVNSAGVYTLNLIPLNMASGANKYAQWAQNSADTINSDSPKPITGDNSVLNGTYTIDRQHVSLVANNGTSDIRVYGNEETIYINTLLSIIDVDTPFTYGANVTEETVAGALLSDASNGNGLTKNGTSSTAAHAGARNVPGAYDANYVFMDASGGDTPATTNRAAIISDVDSVTVGVNNTSIEVQNLTETLIEQTRNVDYEDLSTSKDSTNNNDLAFPKSEIYTLYDKKGYVVAAVTIGEDSGSNSKIAYFTGDNLIKESYVSDETRSGDGYWIWEREAIIDGKEEVLQEKGENPIELRKVNEGDVAEIRFDADGYVRKVNNLSAIGAAGTGVIGGQFSNAINDPTKRFNTQVDGWEEIVAEGKLSVLYLDFASNGTDSYGTGRLTYDGGTLYIDNNATQGFWVGSANVIVAHAKLTGSNHGVLGNVDQHDVISDTYTGTNAMKNALASLDCNRQNAKVGDPDYGFYGYVIAIAEGGRVTSVIINDIWGKSVNDTSSVTGPTSTWDSNATVSQVNNALRSGGRVKISGDWQPTGNNYELEIPANSTLEIDGNFDAGIISGQKGRNKMWSMVQ